jgi:hypothetical protein
MSQIDGNLWLQFIARGTLGNGSSTAAQFPVSSQKPCYDFVRYISNLPSASDTELCFTLWQLKWCRKSNDKTVYSKFQNLSLVVFDINISVSLSHVSNIGSVLVTLFTID